MVKGWGGSCGHQKEGVDGIYSDQVSNLRRSAKLGPGSCSCVLHFGKSQGYDCSCHTSYKTTELMTIWVRAPYSLTTLSTAPGQVTPTCHTPILTATGLRGCYPGEHGNLKPAVLGTFLDQEHRTALWDRDIGPGMAVTKPVLTDHMQDPHFPQQEMCHLVPGYISSDIQQLPQ